MRLATEGSRIRRGAARLPRVKKPSQTVKIIAGVVAGIVVVCCAGSVIIGMLIGDKPKEAKPAAVPTFALPTLALIPSAASPSASPSPSPVPLKMPNVVGQNGAVAQDALKKAGFTNVTLGSADPEDTLVILPQNWKVLEQSTPPGQTVPSDTMIVLTCTKKR